MKKDEALELVKEDGSELENLPDELKDKGKSFKDGLRDLLTGKADVPDLGNQSLHLAL